jgi:hypothetical protein
MADPRRVASADTSMSRATLRSAVVLALAAAALAPGVARADGDPASDVLYTQGIFVPQDAGVPAADVARLAALVRESRRAGYPVKVAVVASSYDLGSVTALWRKPQTYAHFLGVELSLLYRGRLLTVMPNGIGVYHHGRPVTRETAVLSGVAVDRGNLAATAATAVQRLAAAGGHRLAVPVAAPARSRAARGGTSPATWIAFAVGLLLVALAWVVSVRVRPLRRRAHDPA